MKANSRMRPETRTRINVEARLQYVNDILEAIHQTPDLGNVEDPVEELLFLVIAQRTRMDTALRIFRSLRDRFPHVEDLLRASDQEIREVVSAGGRGNLRTRAIRELLSAILEREGSLSLDRLRKMNEEDILESLMGLPWVGEKVARCVMLYSFGINTFPADVNAIRILSRTRILDPMIGSLEGAEHRRAQTAIAKVIPAHIARSLHINMVVHGQKICRVRNPLCTECPVRKFCGDWRDRQVKTDSSRPMTIVDIFCGVGGISLGFHDQGYRTLMAVDIDLSTVEIYRLNHPWVEDEKILCKDVSTLTKSVLQKTITGQRVDVLVAGVPCQGYSRVGYRTKPELAKNKKYRPEHDPRNMLFKQVIRIAGILSPRFILLENVPDIQMANITYYGSGAKVIDLLNRKLGCLGYRTAAVLLDASRFGIPQKRTRLFFIAARQNLPDRIEERLIEIATKITIPGDNRLRGAITDLPKISTNAGQFVINASHNGDTTLVFNHIARFHNDDDLRIIRALKEGEKYTDLVERNPEVLEGRTHKIYSSKNFPDKFYRLSGDDPCRTIVSHLAKDGNGFIHPGQNRSLTVREAARIQTFPDDFIFTESRSAQFVGVGNAVPPVLAAVFARFFRELM